MPLLRDSIARLFARSRRADYLAQYVLRESAAGRSLAEVLNDPYVRNRSTAVERARLLDRPEVVAALGAGALEELRRVRAELTG